MATLAGDDRGHMDTDGMIADRRMCRAPVSGVAIKKVVAGWDTTYFIWQRYYLLIKCTALIKSLKDAPLLHTPNCCTTESPLTLSES
jgi:hypothetical protein